MAVESNVVGYNTTTVTGLDASDGTQLYLLGFQFKSTTATGDEILLKDAIDMSNIPAFDGKWKDRTTAGNAAVLMKYNGVGYTSYFWVGPKCSDLPKNAWVAGSGSKVDAGETVILKAGDAVWFSAKPLGKETATITFAGAVKDEASTAMPFSADELSLLTNPYPMAYNIKDIVPSCPAFTGKWKDRTTAGNAPTIQVWNGVGFVSYVWVAPACSDLAKDAWVAGSGSKVETTAQLPAGQGFWFRNNSGEAGTLTFTFKAAE